MSVDDGRPFAEQRLSDDLGDAIEAIKTLASRVEDAETCRDHWIRHSGEQAEEACKWRFRAEAAELGQRMQAARAHDAEARVARLEEALREIHDEVLGKSGSKIRALARSALAHEEEK